MLPDRCFRGFASVLLGSVLAVGLFAGTPTEEIISKAREYVGGERALAAVTSLRYVGRMELVEAGDGEPRKDTGTIELIFQKPGQQRITQVIGKVKQVIGFASGEAWRRREDVDNPLRAQVAIMNLRQLRRIQAETFENLSFFRGAETQGGRVEARGEATIAGRAAVKLAFVYPGAATFLRSFDKQTGRLLQTETEDGSVVREEGEVVVNGIRFPQRYVQVSKNAHGDVMTNTITFDQILVNEKFDPALFNLEIPGAK